MVEFILILVLIMCQCCRKLFIFPAPVVKMCFSQIVCSLLWLFRRIIPWMNGMWKTWFSTWESIPRGLGCQQGSHPYFNVFKMCMYAYVCVCVCEQDVTGFLRV